MAYYQDKLFVIGTFTIAGNSTINGSALWDGTNWFSLPLPPDPLASKIDIFVHNNSLFLFTIKESDYPNFNLTLYQYNGADFDSISTVSIYYYYTAKTIADDTLYVLSDHGLYSYDWNSWHTKYVSASGVFEKLFSLNDSLYIVMDSVANSIRLFKDSSVNTLIGEFDNSTFGVRGCDVVDSEVFLVGDFETFNAVQCPGILKFNGQSGSTAGWFAQESGDLWSNAYVISSYFDTTTNNLYAGGNFDIAGDSIGYNIARWDGLEWHPMGSGLNGVVYSIIKFNNEIYAAGNFQSSGVDSLEYIARWDGAKWKKVAGGANDYVRCLTVYNDHLIAAGGFTEIGGVNVSYLAQYDGTSWSALAGDSLIGDVRVVKEIDGVLYAGGYGLIYGNSSVAKYDGNWSTMYSLQSITSIIKFDGSIYMSTSQPEVYKWNNSWISLGLSSDDTGEYSQVFDLDGNLCASSINDGFFRYVDGVWNYELSFEVETVAKTGDSSYFFGGSFRSLYTPNGYVPFNNTAHFISTPPLVNIATNADEICNHQYIFYNPLTSDPFLKYEWHFPGGFPDTSTNFKPVVLYNTPGSYAPYAVIENWNGVDTVYLADSFHVVACPNLHDLSYDNVWMMGFQNSKYLFKPGLDFYYGNADTMGFFSPMEFHTFSTSICDTNGILQLYSNGEQLANRYHQIIDNSADFNDDEYFEDYFYTYSPFLQCVLILPYPEHPNQYFIVHTSPRYFGGFSILAPFELWYSIVDMDLNNGAGKMIVKQQNIFSDLLTFSTLQAERHANGRDWWIIIHKYESDKFYLLLLTPNGIEQVNLITAGPVVKTAGMGQSVFSPDGKTFALCAQDSSVVHIFNFDRCEGTLTFSHSIHFDYSSSGGSARSCAFSPDNRYLYVCTFLNLYQLDTLCWTNESCKQLIGEYDGYSNPVSTQFSRMRLAPDDKIYMSTWNGTKHFHVINNPNAAGSSCNFVQHQLKLPSTNINTMPEFPNFRPKVLAGSPCDTIPPDSSISTFIIPSTAVFDVIISPNPASDFISCSIKNRNDDKATITIFNGNLQKVSEIKIENAAMPFLINVSSWSKGIYFCQVTNGKEILWKKIVVQ